MLLCECLVAQLRSMSHLEAAPCGYDVHWNRVVISTVLPQGHMGNLGHEWYMMYRV